MYHLLGQKCGAISEIVRASENLALDCDKVTRKTNFFGFAYGLKEKQVASLVRDNLLRCFSGFVDVRTEASSL